MKTVIEMAGEVLDRMAPDDHCRAPYWTATDKELERFAAIVRANAIADERGRVTNLLLYMHNKAAPHHNYYKHAAVELNRKAGEGEKK